MSDKKSDPVAAAPSVVQPTMCAKCGKPIIITRIVDDHGATYHPACFDFAEFTAKGVPPVEPAGAREWRQRLISIALGRSRANFSHVPECARVMDWIWMDLDTPAVDAVLAEYAASLSLQDKLVADAARESWELQSCGHMKKYQVFGIPGAVTCMVCEKEAAERSLDTLKDALEHLLEHTEHKGSACKLLAVSKAESALSGEGR